MELLVFPVWVFLATYSSTVSSFLVAVWQVFLFFSTLTNDAYIVMHH